MDTANEYTDVLVVGAGPAGLTTAVALAQYGTDHVILERQPGTAHTPRAHIVNQRTTEIMRHLGLQQELEEVSAPWEFMRNSVWYTTLNQPEVARYECWGTDPEHHARYLRASPSPLLNCPQTRFEPVLVRALERAGSEVRFHHELTTVERDGDTWVATVRNRQSDQIYKIRAKYVVGADGAKSKILHAAGLTIEGQSGISNAANIWFRADLSKYMEHRPGVLFWNIHPGPQPQLGLGTLICMRPFTEFVLVKFYDPEQTDLRSISDDEARAHIEAAVGEPVEGIEILNVSGWQVNAQVSPIFSKDGLFCMGDAVHRHPPTNGLGLNMSVADGFNLAWKLALVIKGIAGEELLDTYTQERQPVDAAGVQRAIQSLYDAAAIHSALGLGKDLSEEEGWKQLALLQDPSPAGDDRRKALRQQLANTDYRFNALGLEVGYQYDAGALVVEEDSTKRDRDPVLDMDFTTRPGARLPHARLEKDGQAISSLDLVEGVAFSLLVGLDDSGWGEAAATVSRELGVEISVCRIGCREIADPYFEWADLREVGHDGAVLVRPDRHVAWRSVSRPSDPAVALRQVLGQVLYVDTATRLGREEVSQHRVLDAEHKLSVVNH